VEEIKVLICDHDSQAQTNLRRVIQFDPSLRVVGTAKSCAEALKIISDKGVQVVLMDMRLEDMDGIEAAKRFLDLDPFVQIVLHMIELDTGILRSAMNIGVHDVIKYPMDPEELTARLHTAAERRRVIMDRMPKPVVPADQLAPEPSSPKGKLVAIYSSKGGVGCTFIATNLAVLLHNPETPVVLVDGDFQFGDVTTFLNLQTRNSVSTLVPHLNELDELILDDVLLQYENGMRVLAAPSSPELADELAGEMIAKVLDILLRKYAYVIVDAGSTLDDGTVTILDKADLILTVITPDIPSIKNSRALLNVFSAMEIQEERFLFVLNGYERGDSIDAKKISGNLRVDVIGGLPYDRRAVMASINKGEPLLLNDRSNPLSRAMLKMLGEVKSKLVGEGILEVGTA
jgi:pilus assembly protein CpaE